MSSFFESLGKIVFELNAALSEVANKTAASTGVLSTSPAEDDDRETIVIPSLLINANDKKAPPPIAGRYLVAPMPATAATSFLTTRLFSTQSPPVFIQQYLLPKFYLVTNSTISNFSSAASSSSILVEDHDEIYHAHEHAGQIEDFASFLRVLVPTDLGAFEMIVHILLLVMCFVIGGVTVFLNGVVLRCFVTEASVRTPSNLFIMSLAWTDLGIGLISLPLYTTYLILEEIWPFGVVVCDMWLVMDYTFCLVSQYTVFAITLDRFLSVRFPAKYHRWLTKPRAIAAISIIWILSGVVFGSTIVGWQFFVGERTVPPDACYVQFISSAFFNMIFVICYFWSTLIVIVVLYAQIVYIVWRRQEKTRRITEETLKTLKMNAEYQERETASTFSMKHSECGEGGTMKNRVYNRGRRFFGSFLVKLNSDSKQQEEQSICSLYNKKDSNSSGNTPISEVAGGGLLLKTSWMANGSVKTTTTTCCYQDKEQVSLTGGGGDQESPADAVIAEDAMTPSSSGNRPHIICNNNANSNTTTTSASMSPNNGTTSSEVADEDEPQQGRISNTDAVDSVAAKSVDLLNVEKKENHNRCASCVNMTPTARPSTICQQLINFRRTRDQSFRRTFLMISLILGVFVLTWSPYHLLAIIKGFCDDCVPKSLYNLAYWFCYLSAPINPICYALLNRKFRDAFYRILHINVRHGKNATLRALMKQGAGD